MKNFNKIWRNFVNETDLDATGLAIKQSLHPKFWSNQQLSPKVRRKLLSIAQDVAENLQIQEKIQDIVITGSISSYNWHDMSDIDLHIVLDFAEIDENVDLVDKYLNSQKTLWNRNHTIIINGHEVEIYFQNAEEEHKSLGMYSLMMGSWLQEPTRGSVELDLPTAKKKALAINHEIEKIQDLFGDKKYRLVYNLCDKLKNKIKNMRISGLNSDGVYYPENLAFKLLRNNGLLEILSSLKNLSYDKMMSSSDVTIKISKNV